MTKEESLQTVFIRTENILFRLCKQYVTVAEASPVLRRYKALRLHKGIKHADKRNSLSVEILQIEKLKAAEFGRTQSRFNLILIALRTMCADRLEEISPLRVKSLFQAFL